MRAVVGKEGGSFISEREIFSVFYASEYPAAVRLARLLTDEAAAEDLAQEAFTRLHPRFASLDNPAAYLRTTLVNLGRRWHRTAQRDRSKLGRMELQQTTSLGADELLDAIDALPYRQKAVVVLRYWLDLPEAEIARIIRCRPGTVKSLAARALNRLRTEVGE